ncbi:unnamed protein product, partial [Mesorhabditis belari]|uniref:ATPase inhibitor, mitochondrial n=1 Tax=Mesorhabditis belari TaxID=2138241 RepID=A0AAF3F416_9BILA
MALRQTSVCLVRTSSRIMNLGDPGSGAGKSGGSGGSIRDAGGAFGKMEAAREGEYFHKLQKKQIAEMKKHLADTIKQTEAQLQRHKEQLAELETTQKK